MTAARHANEISVDEIRRTFSYDKTTGRIRRISSGRNAVFVKRRTANGYISAMVSHHSYGLMATRVIYMLETGVTPVGLRTVFADGDQTNLRRDNLTFFIADAEQTGEKRPLVRLLEALKKLGGRASTPTLRQAAGITGSVQLSSYMKMLEARGEAHVCGIDEAHTRTTGKFTFMWQLGPSTGGKSAAELRRQYMATRIKTDSELEDTDRRRRRNEAKRSVSAALKGATANSIFSMAAQLA